MHPGSSCHGNVSILNSRLRKIKCAWSKTNGLDHLRSLLHHLQQSGAAAQTSHLAHWAVFQSKYVSSWLSDSQRLEPRGALNSLQSAHRTDVTLTHKGLKIISSLCRVKSVVTGLSHIHSSCRFVRLHRMYTTIHEVPGCYLPVIPEWAEKVRWKTPSPAWPTDVGTNESSKGGTVLQEMPCCTFFWVSA